MSVDRNCLCPYLRATILGLFVAAIASAGIGIALASAPPEYNISWEDPTSLPDVAAAYAGNNNSIDVKSYFTTGGVRVIPLGIGKPSFDLGLQLSGFGFAGEMQSVEAATHQTVENRIDFVRPGDLTEWYVNSEGRIDQFFSVASAPHALLPDGSVPLHFDFALTGNLTPKLSEAAQSVDFYRADGEPVVRWSGLVVTDAAGRDLLARLATPLTQQGSGPALRIVVIDAPDAVYPISVSMRLTSFSFRLGDISSWEVAPANDLCTGAEVIPASGPFPYVTATTADITDATTTGDPPLPSCQSNVSRSIWYKFTPSTTASYTISSCADAPTASTVDDTVIAVYTSSTSACGGTYTQVGGACDDDSCTTEALQAIVSGVAMTAGTTYFIVVSKYDTPAPTAGNTAVQLRISQVSTTPPANDQCSGAELIPGSGPFPYLTSTTADITNATLTGDPPLPSCQSSVSRSIWYEFTPTTGGSYTISSCADAPTASTVDDTVIAIYTSSSSACGGTYTEASGGCDDDSCVTESLQAVVTANLTGGTKYFVVVHKFSTSAPTAGNTAVQLRVTKNVAPGNDTCATPATLSLNIPEMGTVQSAANDFQLSGAGCFTGIGQTSSTAPGRDVVYSFTAPSAGKYSFRVTNAGGAVSNPVIYVASSCPTGAPPNTVGTCLGAANRNSNTSSAGEEVMCMTLAAAQQVFVFVDENLLTAGGSFILEANPCVQEVESNGTPGTANPQACGVEGSITPANEADFFSLGTLAANARIFSLADGVSGSSNDFDMRVTTSADTLEYDDLNADIPFGSLAPAVGGTKSTGVASFIRMNHFSTSTAAEPYRLYTTVQPPIGTATVESESNGTIGTANSAANNYFSGNLPGPAPSTDADVYKIKPTLAPGALIFAALDGDPEFDGTCTNTKLEVLDSTGTVLQTVNDGGSTSNGRTPALGTLISTTPASCAEALTWRVKTAGDYYVRVSIGTTSTGTSGAGSYLLSLGVNCAATCDDNNVCTTNDTVVSGACVGGPPLNCDDNSVCTADSCDPFTGCQHAPLSGGSCNDNNACTENDTCNNGLCQGVGQNCDDDNPCTDDSCDVVNGGCIHTNNTAACSDGDACTTSDQCYNGDCVGGPALICNDSNVCTDDSCNPSTGCVFSNNTAPCSDGNVCTTADQCSGGSCVGGPPLNCDDGNVCTDDSCNPSTGCVNAPNTGRPCNDNNACTTADACNNGNCVGGPPLNCDDGNCCTADGCNPATGCVYSPNTTPPSFIVQPSLAGGGSCGFLWPPQHGYVDFTTAGTGAVATGSCGGATLEFSSCNSSQPENTNAVGDGNSTRDCVYEPADLHLRAERDGACSPLGRVYTMTVDAVDVCGNRATSAPFTACVWHDRGHGPDPGDGPIYSANPESNQTDTRAGVNGSYGADCGPGCGLTCGEDSSQTHDDSDDDPDSDGIVNYLDNCRAASNFDQADHDGNDIGDVCDLSDGLINNVHFDGKTMLSWDVENGSIAYNVYRGNIPNLSEFGRANCFVTVTTTQANVPAEEAGAPGYFYLVTRKDAAGVESSPGYQSNGRERTVNERCP